MQRFYVKKITLGDLEEDIRYGVFDSEPIDIAHIHCDDELANLIVWTYEKLAAEKIAEVLNVDEYIRERYLEEK